MAILLNTLLLGLTIGASANTIQMNIARDPAVQAAQLEAHYVRSRLVRRGSDSTVTESLANNVTGGLYAASITVGTPPQKLTLQIDTGSSDVWVPVAGSVICDTPVIQGGGCPGGTFDNTTSSTYKVVGPGEFNISYVDGSGAAGDYFTDMFGIGGATVKGLEMGLSVGGQIGQGIMGIGYNTSEANVETGNTTIYANLPNEMVDEGLINSLAYSLWLNDLDSSTGSILFGGIDTDKFSGDLISVDVYPSRRSKSVVSFTVAFTSLSATSSSGTDQLTAADFATAAILDSGTTLTYLPDQVAEMVFAELGAQYDRELDAVVLPCYTGDTNGTFNFGFGGTGGPVIKVPIGELVLPLTLPNGQAATYSNKVAACQLGLQAAGDLPILFGDTFLRSAYVVYDLANNRIGLAQTDFNATSSKVVPFPSFGAQIPSATTAPNQAAVTQTATGVPKVGVTATASGGSAAPTYNPTATGLSAASGFTSSPTGKKKSAANGIEPFAWSGVFVGIITLSMMGVGGGLFALL
ncbi:putative aspartic-type endopeptidase opsB [Lachnellula cervina]|uniref:Probable aspartic-type endopeptidase OPSB n=1 Tax=Lachnellula cervina TaxID=1316786 RepID=A0A7D8URK2_9HELO|nr:putative aspartic-type endopeptidase opsB [Lachnellula cervina]